jgi:hypothetical protein
MSLPFQGQAAAASNCHTTMAQGHLTEFSGHASDMNSRLEHHEAHQPAQHHAHESAVPDGVTDNQAVAATLKVAKASCSVCNGFCNMPLGLIHPTVHQALDFDSPKVIVVTARPHASVYLDGLLRPPRS